MVMMWSAPDTDNMFATSLAEIGARLWKKKEREKENKDKRSTLHATFRRLLMSSKQFMATLSFLSCRAYGKHGMTAVTRQAEAILQALIMIRSSMSPSLISPHPLCTMYTSSPLTDSPISTLQEHIWRKKHCKRVVPSTLSTFQSPRTLDITSHSLVIRRKINKATSEATTVSPRKLDKIYLWSNALSHSFQAQHTAKTPHLCLNVFNFCFGMSESNQIGCLSSECLPGFLIAEFLGDDLPQLYTQAICNFLC